MSDSDSSVPDGFRIIPGFPRYAIDESGTILSVCLPTREADRSWLDARRLKPDISTTGYHRVTLCNEVGAKRVLVHALVLDTYMGPRPGGLQCRHLDGNNGNNHISNLEWGTAKQNSHDRMLHGNTSRGERTPSSKLTADDIRVIRERRANGEVYRVLATEFDVSITTIWQIATRRNWKHI